MEQLGRTNKQINLEKTSSDSQLIFPLNESLLSYLTNFSKEDGEINQYLSALPNKISLSSGQDDNPQEWNTQQRSVYLYFHIVCSGYKNLLEKFRLGNSSENSKLIREEMELLLERGYTSFCESGTANPNNFNFSDIDLNQTACLFTNKNDPESIPDSSQLFIIRITEDSSLLDSSDEIFLNFNSKLVKYYKLKFYLASIWLMLRRKT